MPRRGKRGWPGPPLGVPLVGASMHTPLPRRAGVVAPYMRRMKRTGYILAEAL